MKHAFSMLVLTLLVATAALAAAPADSVLPEATTPDLTLAEQEIVEPIESLEELMPELDAENTSAAQCNDYCYDQAQQCMAACGGNQECEQQCAQEELQCNCDCGAIPFCF